MMTSSTIEDLYTVFGKYTLNGMHHCDCGCIDDKDVLKLASKPLRKLEDDDMVTYHGSALYTWGDLRHYKYYLPRFFELYAQNRSHAAIGLYEIHYKLNYSEWLKWDKVEVDAIKNFILKDWINYINEDRTVRSIDLLELEGYAYFMPLEQLIKLWDITKSKIALRHFVSLFYYNGSYIFDGNFKVNKIEQSQSLLKLLNKEGLIEKLEDAFFEFEQKDETYANKVSVVLQMIEQHRV